MTLAPGSRLGHYEIVAELGAGGMGEVYRARDPKLNRDVAIKVLLAAVASDPDRLARFSREAQVLASLNHPNIAAIYGLEEGPAEAGRQTSALVMELVEGSTLADRLATGPLPVDEAIAIASQIADALQAAHEAGIIHRDLKPANIKVRPDGTVKVLDFGLAKALDPGGGSGASAMNSPTLSVHGTQMGVILGTAAYMSPEQARGRAVDRRADIWAFGVVLFEMLTGRRAFEGDDISITLASVLKDEMRWDALPADLPTPLRRLLRRCLEKDPKHRLSSIGDARLELNDARTPPSDDGFSFAPAVVGSAPRRKAFVPWLVAAVAGTVALAAIVLWAPWRPDIAPPKASFEVRAGSAGANAPFMLALSPDGRHLVARVTEQGVNRLWLRPIERLNGTAMQGTDVGQYPFWSADSRQVGFFANGKLMKVDLFGAAAQTLADAAVGRGGAWNRDGVIVFAPTANGGLFRVGESGGPLVPITQLDNARGETAHLFPRFLPDGNHFLFLVLSHQPQHSGIYASSLNSKDKKFVVGATIRPEFAPPNLLLFLRERTLMVQRFDLVRLELSGDPFQVAEDIGGNPATGVGGMTVSETGVLAYRPGGDAGARQLIWFNRTGVAEGNAGPSAMYENPRLSPDGTRVAVFKAEGSGDIWINDLERGSSTRFTFSDGADNVPVWSPDGNRIAFVSNRDGGILNLYVKDAGGTTADALLLKTPHNKLILDWSPDGRYILYQEADPATKEDLWVLPLFGDGKPMRVVGSPANDAGASFSPDGRWIAYTSDEAGRRQVFVQSFPPTGGKWQVSTTNLDTMSPRWRPDGKELFFDVSGQLTVVDLTGTIPGTAFKAGVPTPLFRGLQNLPPHNYDVAPDGRRFLVLSAPSLLAEAAPITVVVNWMSGLKP
ncbi:MAG: protein kinase [Acidobacteriota bacterium]|nr:protein kinase [Acidobacteriota bacterium]